MWAVAAKFCHKSLGLWAGRSFPPQQDVVEALVSHLIHNKNQTKQVVSFFHSPVSPAGSWFLGCSTHLSVSFHANNVIFVASH